MPIYAYRCATCGHAQDVLQKLSDSVLSTCPACGASTFSKQVTAAGFQLKGSGWYVTDFRNGNTAAPAKPEGGAKDAGDPVSPVPAPATADPAPAAEKSAAKPAEKTTAAPPPPPAAPAASS